MRLVNAVFKKAAFTSRIWYLYILKAYCLVIILNYCIGFKFLSDISIIGAECVSAPEDT